MDPLLSPAELHRCKFLPLKGPWGAEVISYSIRLDILVNCTATVIAWEHGAMQIDSPKLYIEGLKGVLFGQRTCVDHA